MLGGALVGTSVLVTLPLPGCVDADPTSAIEQSDWAQYEGKRDTRMVAFTGAWSHGCALGNTRFGCGAIAIQLTVRVRPQPDADLAWKRVGVVYRSPNDLSDRTAIGSYSHTNANGDEEWNVTVTTPAWQPTILFDAWYQDGKGATFIDDNEGEFHVVNAGPDYNLVRVEPWLGTVAITDAKVTGRISVQLSDLDFDKEVELIATPDDWQTVLHFGTGASGSTNKFYWVEDFPFAQGRERWQIDLDVPTRTSHFQYAVVYRHGVANGARTYEFWDNNGGANYQVDRAVVQ